MFDLSEGDTIFGVISQGAISIVQVIVAIVCNVIAFMAIFGLIDAVIAWFLGMINLKNSGLSVI